MERDEERFEKALGDLGPTYDRQLPGDPDALLRRLKRTPDRARPRGLGFAGLAAALAVLLVGVPWVLRGNFAHPTSPKPANKTGQVKTTGAPPLASAEITSLGPVDFLNARQGYVAGMFQSGAGATALPGLLYTKDGGRSFTLGKTAGYEILALQFQNAEQGYAIGSTPDMKFTGILTTSDGGRHWTVAHRSRENQAMSNGTMQTGRVAIRMFGQSGYAFDGQSVLMTQDGGRSWNRVTALPANFAPVQAAFVSQGTMFVAGQACPGGPNSGNCQPEVLVSRNGGGTFRTAFTPQIPQGQYMPYGDAVTFADSQHGFFYWFNGATMSAALYATSDGGQNWSEINPQFAQGRTVYGAMQFASPTFGWMAMAAGAAPVPGGLLVTRDGGHTWKNVGQKLGWSIQYAQLLSGNVGFAVGGMGGTPFLVRTVDGGRTFSQLLPAVAPTTDMRMVNRSIGFGVGTASNPLALLTTRDGGSTWSRVADLPGQGYSAGPGPQAVAFSSPEDGWAVALSNNSSSQGLQLLRTSDGGKTWTAGATDRVPYTAILPQYPYVQRYPDGSGILEVSTFPEIQLARVLQNGAKIAPMQSIPGTPGTWPEISFATPEDGFVAVSNPGTGKSGSTAGVEIYSTTDGGKTWRKSAGPSLPIFGLSFVTPDLGYAIAMENPYFSSQQPVLLRTEDGGRTWTKTGGALPGTLMPIGNDVRIDFVSKTRGYLLFQNGAYVTTDGGSSFRPLP